MCIWIQSTNKEIRILYRKRNHINRFTSTKMFRAPSQITKQYNNENKCLNRRSEEKEKRAKTIVWNIIQRLIMCWKWKTGKRSEQRLLRTSDYQLKTIAIKFVN